MLKLPSLAASLVALSGLAVTAYSQTVGHGLRAFDRPANEAKYSLQGTVVDSVTGEPVRHALVQIYSPARYLVFSDGEGHFVFNHLPSMQTQLTVTKPGYMQEGGDENGNVNLRVTIGADMQPLTVRMSAQGELDGTITDSSGQILDAVPIMLYHFPLQNGVRKRQNYRQAQTDEDGEYHFYQLPPGDYVVSAGPSWKDLSNPLLPGKDATFAYPQTFYPGAADVSAAAVLHLTALSMNALISRSPRAARSWSLAASAPLPSILH